MFFALEAKLLGNILTCPNAFDPSSQKYTDLAKAEIDTYDAAMDIYDPGWRAKTKAGKAEDARRLRQEKHEEARKAKMARVEAARRAKEVKLEEAKRAKEEKLQEALRVKQAKAEEVRKTIEAKAALRALILEKESKPKPQNAVQRVAMDMAMANPKPVLKRQRRAAATPCPPPGEGMVGVELRKRFGRQIFTGVVRPPLPAFRYLCTFHATHPCTYGLCFCSPNPRHD